MEISPVSVLLFLLALVLVAAVAIIVYKMQKKPKRIMHEGKLVKSDIDDFDNIAQPLIL